MNREQQILIVHDNTMGMVLFETFLELDFRFATTIRLAESVPEANDLLSRNYHPSVIIAHKDIITGGTITDLMRSIRDSTDGPLIRVGFASQEFFGNRICKTAQALGADFGWDPTGGEGVLPDWVLAMIDLGLCSQAEIGLRTHEVILDYAMAKERLRFLGTNGSSIERR
jgi:hypothetical protein